jgi:hypothetical protein
LYLSDAIVVFFILLLFVVFFILIFLFLIIGIFFILVVTSFHHVRNYTVPLHRLILVVDDYVIVLHPRFTYQFITIRVTWLCNMIFITVFLSVDDTSHFSDCFMVYMWLPLFLFFTGYGEYTTPEFMTVGHFRE